MNRTRKTPADSKHKKGRAEVCPGVSLADPLGVFAIGPVSYPGALTPCIPLQFKTAEASSEGRIMSKELQPWSQRDLGVHSISR